MVNETWKRRRARGRARRYDPMGEAVQFLVHPGAKSCGAWLNELSESEIAGLEQLWG